MTHTNSPGRKLVGGVLLATAIIVGWWWTTSAEPDRVSGLQPVDPAVPTPLEPVVGTDVAFTVSGFNGVATTGDSTIDANAKSTMSVRFTLPTDRRSLPSGVLKIYRTKANGGRTIMQTSTAVPVSAPGEQQWQVDFEVDPIRVPGEFGVEIRGSGSNGFAYYVPAATTVRVVK